MSKTDVDALPVPLASGSPKALVKGLHLVDIVAASREPLRQADLVTESDLPRPTAVRLLEVLCQLDVLRVDAGHRYRLGPRVVSWGQAFLEHLDLVQQATDILEDLARASGETVYLGIAQAESVLYVAAVPSSQAVRPAARTGSRNPLYCTGIGKVLLASLPPGERGILVPHVLRARTDHTITDHDALSVELDLVTRRGYAVDDIENEDGVRCVAAPVRDHTGATIAAISVSAPAYRFSLDDVTQLAPVAVSAAGQLSERLGHRTPADEPAAEVTVEVAP